MDYILISKENKFLTNEGNRYKWHPVFGMKITLNVFVSSVVRSLRMETSPVVGLIRNLSEGVAAVK
jgi:hypothetical protein